METKKCKACNLAKPTSEYGSHPVTANGLQARCKTCINAAARRSRANKTGIAKPRWKRTVPVIPPSTVLGCMLANSNIMLKSIGAENINVYK